MLYTAAVSVLICGAVSTLLALVGFVLVLLTQGNVVAAAFVESYVFRFNGILVFGFGYGTLFFILRYRKELLKIIFLSSSLSDSDLSRLAVSYERSASFAKLNLIAVPIFLAGSSILWMAGYPLEGVAKHYLAITSMSLYYAGGLLLAYAYYTIRFFGEIDRSVASGNTSAQISQLDIEAFGTFFSITSTLGVISLYLAFRGTLTANFTFSFVDPALLRRFFFFPIIIFLWAPIFVAMYPRWVLKKIFKIPILQKIENIERKIAELYVANIAIKDLAETEKSLLEIRDKYFSDLSRNPVISIKDSLSIALAMLSSVQLIISNDVALNQFFKAI
jgi:hypothetical protein